MLQVLLLDEVTVDMDVVARLDLLDFFRYWTIIALGCVILLLFMIVTFIDFHHQLLAQVAVINLCCASIHNFCQDLLSALPWCLGCCMKGACDVFQGGM